MGGSQRRYSENTKIRRIAKKKLGMDTPSKATVVTSKSDFELRRVAEIMPVGIAIASAISMASTVSSIVTGKRDTMSCDTSLFERIERPRSPCTTRDTHVAYWTGS